MSKVISRVSELVHPVAVDLGLELVDVSFRKVRGRWHLQVLIDKPGGVTMDDCEAVNKHLSAAMDSEDLVGESYTLEVSSPGLDRPLNKIGDFRRFQGRKARVKTFAPVDDQKSFTGVIKGVDEDQIQIELDDGKLVAVPYEKIAKANLEIEI